MLQSKYENWNPINKYVNPEQREYLDWELLEEYQDNIFFRSNIPIVKNKRKVKYILSTHAFREPDGNYCKSSQIIYRYVLNKIDFVLLSLEIKKLNRYIQKHSSIKYCFPIFSKGWSKNALFDYEYEKNIFSFRTFTENKKMSNVLIEYTEDGKIKKATINKGLKNGSAKSSFKGYKDGLDLYMVTYEGEIKYRRLKK